MRKIYLLLLCFICLLYAKISHSQASVYTFAVSSGGTYTQVNDATATRLAAVEADTYISPAQNIGFNFVYEGITYTQFTMSSNGFISFNTTAATLTTNNFSTANTASRPIVAPLWDDLSGTAPSSASKAYYEVTGTAPNRVLTVEWRNWQWNYASTSAVISFEAKLYETTNIIQFIYRSETGAVNSGSASIGIGSATGSGAGSYLNLTSVTTPAVSSTTSNTTIATKPATGDIYTFSPPPPCSGTPIPGTASTTTTGNVCSGNSVTISLTGTTAATGITYQWQWAVAGSGSWNNIASATTAAVTVNVPNTSTDFRCVVTCTSSTQSANSNTVTINVNPASYAPLPFAETFEGTWINGCGTKEIPTTSWSNNPLTGANSWRRDDDGVASSGWSSNSGSYTPAGANGTAHSARIHTYSTSSSGIFDLFVNCSSGISAKQLAYNYINASGSDSLKVFLSIDGGSTFSFIGSKNTVSATWSNIVVPFTSSSATTVIRFIAYGDAGSSDIGIDEVSVIGLTGCTGTPPTLTVTGPSSVCAGVNSTLNGTGFNLSTSGIVYRWQSSTNNVNWTNTTGTNPSSFVVAPIVNSYYRLVDTCTASGQFSISNVIQVTINPATYASLPFTEGFEGTWINGCGTADIPSNSWRNIPVSTDSSWRREDDAPGSNTASWNNATSYLYSPAFSQGAHSARFHSGYVNNRSRGIMDLYLDCSTGSSNKQLNFDYINTNGTDSLTVLLSTDGGASFVRLDTVFIRAVWSTKQINFTSLSATTVIRFIATGDYGSTDIGLDNVNVITLSACSGTPTPGSVSGPSQACSGVPFSLSVTGYTTGVTGIGFQWQSSPTGTNTWNNIALATGTSVNVSQTSATDYRCVVTCGGTNPANTNTIIVPMQTAGCPPANDDCIGATVVTQQAYSTTPTYVNGTTVAASTSSNTSSCFFSSQDDDVWYKFTATNSLAILKIANWATASGAPGTFDYGVYSGSCASATEVTCIFTTATNGEYAVAGLIPGNDYFVRILTDGTGGRVNFSFAILQPDVTPGAVNTCLAGAALTVSATNNNQWLPLYDATTNKIFAEVNAQGNNLGAMTSKVYVNSGAVRASGNGIYYLDRNFEITPTTQPATAVKVRLYLLNSELTALQNQAGSNVTGLSSLNVTKSTGVCGASITGAGSLIIPNSRIVYGANGAYLELSIPGFSTFFINGGSAALPVSINSFKGERQGTNNVLSWTTTAEVNNSGFELQRSADGVNFSSLVFVNSKSINGNSTTLTNYELTDTKALVAGSYYRLKQIDKDGKSTLSQIVYIKGIKATKLELVSIYPNPTVENLNVSLVSPKADNITFIVSDITGKVIFRQIASVVNGDNNIKVNVSSLAKGTYTIKAVCADGCETAISKFVKQ